MGCEITEGLTLDKVREYIDLELDEFYLENLRQKHGIASTCKPFYVAISRLLQDRKIKRVGRGYYRKVKQVEPVQWWNNTNETPIEGFRFPQSHTDGTKFGIEDLVEIFPGDFILIGGVSNYGKTALVMNIIGENIDLMPIQVMGNEYTAADGKISPKFKRRLDKMSWVKWLDDDSQPRFTLLPVDSDYEDYIRQDALNAVDWISLPGEYYLIDRVMKAMKDKVGYGLLVGVLQKDRLKEWAEGGERIERHADIYLKIDPCGDESLLTIGKVKAPKSRVLGRMWGFKIVDYGANLSGIHEVIKCNKCNGFGKNYGKKCAACNGMGYRDKEEYEHDV